MLHVVTGIQKHRLGNILPAANQLHRAPSRRSFILAERLHRGQSRRWPHRSVQKPTECIFCGLSRLMAVPQKT